MSHFCNMLSNIRVACKTRHLETKTVNSKLCISILDKIYKLGFIRGFTVVNKQEIKIFLKYVDGLSALRDVKALSTPGKRVFCSYSELKRLASRGSGFLIVSTSKGLLTDVEAINFKIGGEVLLRIW